ncbi:hypothetical protein SDIAM26S_05709 [Streptomyces diastaticus subsp. diastaticus]
MENFFALLQKNVLDRRSWANHQELRIAIVAWIERAYHRRRRQRRLARLTPVDYEPIMTPPAARVRYVNPNCHPITQQSQPIRGSPCSFPDHGRPENNSGGARRELPAGPACECYSDRDGSGHLAGSCRTPGGEVALGVQGRGLHLCRRR